MKKFISFILIVTSFTIFISCSDNKKNNEDALKNNSKIKVVVSFNPMKEFVEAIGGDKVEITTMIPKGAEPHDFEPKIRDMESLSKSQIFVYNGLGMEGWVSKVLGNIDKENIEIVEASKGVNPIENTSKDEIKEHGKYDPHTWLSLKAALKSSENIKDALVKVDSKNKSYYEENFNKFQKEINSLYNDYNGKFSKLENKHFVTGHAAFGYLCREFGLEQNSVEDIFAEGEPSAKKMKELVDYCKKNNIKTIFVEENISPEVSKTLAKEVGGNVVKIYTLENKQDGKNYIESMKYNLEKIYESLK